MTTYMQIDGIKGNVTAKGHEGWSEINAFGFCASRYITTHVGSTQDRESGMARISEFEIIKPIDNTTPHLFAHLCNGQVFKKVTIDICHSDSQLQAHHTYVLDDVLISKYEDVANNKGLETEYIRFNFTKIEKKYTPRDQKGNLGSPLRSNFNLTTAEAG